MKTTRLNLWKMAFYLFIGLSITLTSCSGKDGEDGLDGMDGINGEQGPQGPAGEDGNANVIASDWFNINWTESEPAISSMQIEVPELDIEEFTASGGVVLVYLKIINDEYTTTYLLPFELFNAKFEYGVLNVSEGFNGILVLLTDPDTSGLYLEILNNPAFTIRYVLVPANVADQTGLALNIPPTFEDAKTLLGLD
jgi:hypothetical protein